jgi:hypothetical protein
MPTKRTHVSAAVLSPEVQAIKQPPTAPPRTIDAVIRLSKVRSADLIHMLSACLQRLRTIEGFEWAVRATPSLVPRPGAVSVARFEARSSEHLLLAAPASQRAQLAGHSHTWGA